MLHNPLFSTRICSNFAKRYRKTCPSTRALPHAKGNVCLSGPAPPHGKGHVCLSNLVILQSWDNISPSGPAPPHVQENIHPSGPAPPHGKDNVCPSIPAPPHGKDTICPLGHMAKTMFAFYILYPGAHTQWPKNLPLLIDLPSFSDNIVAMKAVVQHAQHAPQYGLV